MKENIKPVTLEFFQISKTFCQGSSVKSKLSTPPWTLLEMVGKRQDKKLLIFACSKLTPKSQQILSKLVSSTPPPAPQGATPQKAQQVALNWNNLIAGSGQRAIKIQDLVRRLNKWTNQGCFWKAWSPQKQYWWTQISQQGIEL